MPVPWQMQKQSLQHVWCLGPPRTCPGSNSRRHLIGKAQARDNGQQCFTCMMSQLPNVRLWSSVCIGLCPHGYDQRDIFASFCGDTMLDRWGNVKGFDWMNPRAPKSDMNPIFGARVVHAFLVLRRKLFIQKPKKSKNSITFVCSVFRMFAHQNVGMIKWFSIHHVVRPPHATHGKNFVQRWLEHWFDVWCVAVISLLSQVPCGQKRWLQRELCVTLTNGWNNHAIWIEKQQQTYTRCYWEGPSGTKIVDPFCFFCFFFGGSGITLPWTTIACFWTTILSGLSF